MFKDTWVEMLMLAISDPHIKCIWVYGDGGTGKPLWWLLVGTVTSAVQVLEGVTGGWETCNAD